ncbi:MAG TPA: hypothetical protein PKI48_10490 [Chitinophagales bacterium]|nr:hypothetical protein [Chitinophagales bacterium]
MFLKVTLFLIPPFYVYQNGRTQGYVDLCVAEFDTERGLYGFKKPSFKQKMITKKTFAEKYGFKIAFYSDIMLELYKQGRSLKWLHRVVNENGYNITYISFSKMVNNNLNMSKPIRLLVNSVLHLY